MQYPPSAAYVQLPFFVEFRVLEIRNVTGSPVFFLFLSFLFLLSFSPFFLPLFLNLWLLAITTYYFIFGITLEAHLTVGSSVWYQWTVRGVSLPKLDSKIKMHQTLLTVLAYRMIALYKSFFNYHNELWMPIIFISPLSSTCCYHPHSLYKLWLFILGYSTNIQALIL